MNRREFFKGVLAAGTMSIADWRLFAEENALPAYYGDYLAEVARRVRERAARGRDAFWFLTDPHVMDNRKKSGFVLARLIRETGVTKVFCGGDIPCAFGSRKVLEDSLNIFRSHWIDPIEKSGGRFYLAKGNHDFTIRESMTSENGATLDARASRAFLLSTRAAAKVVTNPSDPEGAYFFFDEPESRLRYIFADTTDSILPSRPYWAVMSGIHERQLAWLRDCAFATLPPSYGIVTVHHIPVTGVVGTAGEVKVFANFRELLQKNAAKVLLDITGHHHREGQTCQNGTWFITEPCDAAYSDYINGSLPWAPGLPKKNGGTVFENTFDAIVIDKDDECLHIIRVGGGAERTLFRSSQRLTVGATHAFHSTLGKVTWGCHDADRVLFKPDPANRWNHLLDFQNDFGTIDPNGVFTASKPGESVVLARSEDGRKEIFPVTVVAG